MFGTKARSRRSIAPAVQALESRSLMSATATLATSGPNKGLLTITGTSGDNKLVLGSGANSSVVYLTEGNQRVAGPFQVSAIKAISANLQGGLDDLTIDLKGQTLTRVDVLFGTGGWTRNPERLNLFGGRVGQLFVDARSSSTSHVQLKNLTVTGTADLQYGTDTGEDTFVATNCLMGTLKLAMGGGKDGCNLYSSTITTAQIDMGDGNDSLLCNATVINGGTLNGGAGWSDDLVRTNRSRVTATIFNFEGVA